MEVDPLSIIFVKSDSKGDRLLFRYPSVTQNGESSAERRRSGRQNPFALTNYEDLLQNPFPPNNYTISSSSSSKGGLTGFTDEVLSTLFAVKAELCNRKFELKVNDVRFVGHPTLLPYRSNKDDTASMILINIVFALKACASHSIVKCYYDLSKRLGKALRHEEKRCSYLSDEMKIMMAAIDELSNLDAETVESERDTGEDTKRPSAFDLIRQRSSLARSLVQVFNELTTCGVVQARINNWVLVSFCLPHKAHQLHNGLPIEPETIDKCLGKLKPYHGMLLLVDPNELLDSMPLDGSTALLRLIKLYSPLKSLQTIAVDADLQISQLISEAIRHGDRHKETMETADFWLLEKELVHKLFKVLVPRFENSYKSYTRMWQAPTIYPGLELTRAVLELRGNPFPPLTPDHTSNRNLLHNVLLDAAKLDYRRAKYAEVAHNMLNNAQAESSTHTENTQEKIEQP